MLRGFLLLVFSVCFGSGLRAQNSGDKCLWIRTFGTPVVLDSLTVIPESITVHSPLGQKIDFELNLNENAVTLSKTDDVDSVKVCFQTLPFDLHSKRTRRTFSVYDSAAPFKDAALYQQSLGAPKRDEIFKTKNITKTGSITRGISFGNRQDVFVNSNLNLQMEGKLSDDVNIRAVISDRNVPFQPEGNTQQLQDFDNVYIQLYNENWSLVAGDVVLQSQPSDFLKFYKNVQGARFQTQYKIGERFKANTSVAGSVAKGKFASISVTPIEGVLGPYRVRGPENERFIIVLAGSEKVFLDGKRLTRGFDHDYVIDYNLGEITFTNRVLITQFSRIRVDFEYSDQNYTRSIFQASHHQSNDKVHFFLNFYSEKDNRNRPLSFDLTQTEKRALEEAGDQREEALTSRVDSVAYSPDVILYRKTVGTDASGNVYEIFQQSTNPDSAFFNVSFSDVGSGNGNYVLQQTTTNGRVYEWVSPVNGVPQGNYEPVYQLALPDQKRMLTLGGGVQLNKYGTMNAEVAFSKNDLNLFSEKEAEDDQGKAFKLRYEHKEQPIQWLNGYKLNANLSYEFNDDSFAFIDRVRAIEFDRDWSFNATDFEQQFSENILNAGVGLKKDLHNQLHYRLVRRKRGEAVDGFQHYLDGSKELGRFLLRADFFSMNNDQITLGSSWTRFLADVSYRAKWLVPGYQYSVDRNEVRHKADNRVVSTVMNFEEHAFYLRNADTLKTTYGVDFRLREDRLPVNGELVNNNRSQTWNAFFKTKIKEAQDLSMLFTYRNLEDLRQTEGRRDDKTIMGRLDWYGHFFKRAVRSELTYALANSRELRREFVFVQVPVGEGTHTWRDDDQDGVQDLNEFYLAINADEKIYAKIFVPTDTYEEAFNTNISYRLSVKAPGEWRRGQGLKRFLSRFSNNTSWSLDAKVTDDATGARLLPIAGNVNEDSVLSSRRLFRSTLFFNRSQTGFTADFGYSTRENKQLLVNGFETIDSRELRAHGRWNIQRRFNIDLVYLNGERSSDSDFLTLRNYQVRSHTYQPSVSWQPGAFFRLKSTFSRKEKRNTTTEGLGEMAIHHRFSMEGRFAKAGKTTLNATINYINIDLSSLDERAENSPLGYELLEALQPGKNFTWVLNMQQKLGSGLQLTLRYDGRKSGEQRAVHVGRVQLSAFF